MRWPAIGTSLRAWRRSIATPERDPTSDRRRRARGPLLTNHYIRIIVRVSLIGRPGRWVVHTPPVPRGARRHVRPVAVSLCRLLVVLRRLRRIRAAGARARPRRVPPPGARGQRARGSDLERRVGRAGPRLQLPLLPLHALALSAGAGARRPRPRETRNRLRARVPGRLRRREGARGRQRLRVRRRVFLFRGAPQVPAPRAVLRHPRRAGVPRPVHLARLGADAVPLDRRRCSAHSCS